MILEATMGSRRDKENKRKGKKNEELSSKRKKKPAGWKPNRVGELHELHDLSGTANVKIVDLKKIPEN